MLHAWMRYALTLNFRISTPISCSDCIFPSAHHGINSLDTSHAISISILLLVALSSPAHGPLLLLPCTFWTVFCLYVASSLLFMRYKLLARTLLTYPSIYSDYYASSTVMSFSVWFFHQLYMIMMSFWSPDAGSVVMEHYVSTVAARSAELHASMRLLSTLLPLFLLTLVWLFLWRVYHDW